MYSGISSWYVLFGVIEVVSENIIPHLHNFVQIFPLVIQQVQELTDIMSATKYSPQALGAVITLLSLFWTHYFHFQPSCSGQCLQSQ